LAYEPHLGREVALKVPHEYVLADPELRARFQREARAAAGLDHPNIVPVHEAGEVDSVCYIALAYCPGMTLHEWLRRRVDSIPGPQVAEFVAILADAIQHAHEQGIVHRDLKPANVLLTGDFGPASAPRPLPSLSSLLPKVTDFGLAKHLGRDDMQTRTGTLAGTPCYMAPEQTGASPWQVGPATDVHALGAILYELLTGRAPFQGETVLDTLHQVRHEEPVPPRRLRPGLPRDLETICLKCLEKDPTRRYSSSRSLVQDLHRYLNGHSILARPSGPLTHVAKWAVRRPAAAGLIAACLAVVALLVASDLYIRHKNRLIEKALAGETKANASLGQSLAREQLTTYFHRVRLAQAAIADSNIRQAERYLNACAQPSRGPDVRGWEWHYLSRLCRQELVNFRGHTNRVWDVAISPDGTRCASIGAEGPLLLWDARTGETAIPCDYASDGKPTEYQLQFSPDSKLLAVGCRGRNEVVILSAASGERLLTLVGSDPRFRHEGGQLATIDGAGRQHCIYDVATGKLLSTIERPWSDAFAHAFRGDALTIASYRDDGVICLWEGATDQPRILTAPADHRYRLQFSDDGRFLAAFGFTGSVVIWDVATASELISVTAHKGALGGLAFRSDGKQFASADILGAINIWDLRGRLVRTLPGHGSSITQICFSDDGRRLVSSSIDSTVKIWDLDRESQPTTIRGQETVVYAVAIAPRGGQIASAGFEGGARVWNVASGGELRRLDSSAVIRHLVFRSDGTLVGCDSVGAVHAWNPATGEQYPIRFAGRAKQMTVCALSAQANYVAVVGDDHQTVTVRRVPAGDVAYTVRGESAVRALCFSGDEQWLTVAEDGSASIFRVPRGGRRSRLACGEVTALAMSRDGRFVATGGNSDLIQVWDAASGDKVYSLPSQSGRSNVLALAFSGDGRRLASGGFGAAVMLWDLSSGEEALELPTHYMGVTALAFSDDGWQLAAVINDGSIAVWNAAPRPRPDP
jgi:WD40 repeat protein